MITEAEDFGVALRRCMQRCGVDCQGLCRLDRGAASSDEVATAPTVTTSVTSTSAVTDELFPIVIFKPDDLFVDGDPTRGFRPRTTGKVGPAKWAAIVAMLSRAHTGDPSKHPDANIQKAARGGWSACRLEGGRRLATAFTEARLLGLDIDKNGDIDRALKAFEPFAKIVHSTYKSTEAAPRCRVILPLVSTCISADPFKRAHLAVRQAVVRGGWFKDDDFDDAGSDPSRLWYLPMVPPGVTYRFEVTHGELLDLDRLVAKKEPRGHTKKTSATTSATTGAAALAWAARKMAATAEGHRHTTVFSVAAWLGEIVPPISEDDIMEALLLDVPEGHDADFRRTIRDGIRHARAA